MAKSHEEIALELMQMVINMVKSPGSEEEVFGLYRRCLAAVLREGVNAKLDSLKK